MKLWNEANDLPANIPIARSDSKAASGGESHACESVLVVFVTTEKVSASARRRYETQVSFWQVSWVRTFESGSFLLSDQVADGRRLEAIVWRRDSVGGRGRRERRAHARVPSRLRVGQVVFQVGADGAREVGLRFVNTFVTFF